MSRQDIQKLLGGYATGTLTAAEQQALFEAALDDQELFDALAREQALRDLLRDPASKARLLAALDEAPTKWYQRWGWWRPAAAAMAMAAIAILVITVRHGRSPEMVMTAQVSQPAVSRPVLDREAEPATVDGKPRAEAKRAPANPAPAGPQEELKQRADPPGAAVTEKRKADLPAVNDSLRAEESKTKAALAKEAEVDAVGSVAPAAPQPSRPATVASGFRDNAPGAVGGAAAPAPPPARRAATEESAAVQAAANASNSVYVLSARELFYGVPQARAFTQARQQLTQQLSRQQQPGPQQQTQQGQQGRTAPLAMAPAKALRAPQPANLGVRYRFVFKADSGYLDVDSKSLKAGDTVMLEFTANDSGELMVTSGDRRIVSRNVQRLAPYVVGPLDPNDKELSVVFTRAGTVTITGAAAFASRKKDEAAADSLHRADADGAVYVVGEPAAQQVRFTIPLNYK